MTLPQIPVVVLVDPLHSQCGDDEDDLRFMVVRRLAEQSPDHPAYEAWRAAEHAVRLWRVQFPFLGMQDSPRMRRALAEVYARVEREMRLWDLLVAAEPEGNA